MAWRIKLVRHAESMSNAGLLDPQVHGDHRIPLSETGQQQALALGKTIGQAYLRDALIYTSPYTRARQTLAGILEGSGARRDTLRIHEDPRLREMDFGYGDVAEQQKRRAVHGWFYYRFQGGESPADCYDRTSDFLESLMRRFERKQRESALIVTHGLTIRCFVMRFLYLRVEDFDRLENPHNGDLITLGPLEELPEVQFSRGQWGVSGLRFYPDT